MPDAELERLWEAAPDPARRYVMLALRLERHVDGVVDAYIGPSGPAADAASGDPVDPEVLLAEANALREELRPGWLHDQARALCSVAGQAAGRRADPVEDLRERFGVVPRAGAEAAIHSAHRALDALLPGDGALWRRLQDWRERDIVPPERVAAAVRQVIAAAQRATARHVPLPDGEGIDLEITAGAPWMAYCVPVGGLRSEVTVNVDVPVTPCELVILAMHETYPGHHAERACKEHLLLYGEGRLEEALVVAPSPQSVVSEGIAEAAPLALLGADGGREAEATLAAAGIRVRLAHALAVERARMPLRWAVVDAGLMWHRGCGMDAVEAHLQDRAVMDPATAARVAAMFTDPGARGYEIAYAAGAERCAVRLAGGPSGLPDLLTRQVRVADLPEP